MVRKSNQAGTVLTDGNTDDNSVAAAGTSTPRFDREQTVLGGDPSAPMFDEPATMVDGEDLGLAAGGRTPREKWFISLLILPIVLVLWEIIAVGFHTPRYILPTPVTVASSIYHLHGTLLTGTLQTAREILLGFVIGVVAGVAVAAVSAYSRLVERLIMPGIVMSQAVPKIAVAPLFLLWFGLGLLPKVLIAAALCFFPVVIAGVTALKSVDPAMISMAKASRASTTRIFWKIRMPLAASGILSGIRLGMTLAAIGAVIGEFIDPGNGLGGIIMTAQGNQNAPAAFAGLVILSVLTLVLYYLVVAAEWFIIGRKQT